MKGILAIMDREIRAYFFSPLAYIVAAFLLLVNGMVFWLIVSFLNNPQAGFGAPLELFFGTLERTGTRYWGVVTTRSKESRSAQGRPTCT